MDRRGHPGSARGRWARAGPGRHRQIPLHLPGRRVWALGLHRLGWLPLHSLRGVRV